MRAVALAGTVASVLIAGGWRSTVARQRDERLERSAASRTATISNALGHFENALQAQRSLWVASTSVTRPDFARFAHTLDLGRRYPGLQGIGWREVVPGGEADDFVRQARADGAPGFSIHPPGRRPVYYVMRYSYPVNLFGTQLGADARAVPTILAAMEQARDTGQTTISSQTTLSADQSLPRERRPTAFELFVPVYQGGSPPATLAGRRARFLGWASGHFRAGDFLEAALRTTQPFTGVELHDEAIGRGSLVASFPAGWRAGGPYVRTESFNLAGRRFVLRYAPLPGNAILTERTIPAELMLGTGVGVSLLLGTALWLLAKVGALAQQVGRLARTDALTGTANRRAWDDELPRELARAVRSGQPLCVALVDLDRFKAYNDRHGHQAGCARPTCWPATAGRSSRSCCPTASSRTPWRSPTASGRPSPRGPARSASPPGTAARRRSGWSSGPTGPSTPPRRPAATAAWPTSPPPTPRRRRTPRR